MIGCCNDFDTNLTEIRLDCLGKDTVNRILSDLLSLSPRLVCGLSDIVYQKSKGSPLYMSQLLISLKRDGLLRLSLRDKRWVWDEARIQSRQLPNDVASFFTRCISSLPEATRTSMQALSCFGAAVHSSIIEILEHEGNLTITKPLIVALEEGFISRWNYFDQGMVVF